MKKKVIGIFIIGILIATMIPCVSASSDETEQEAPVYESMILGIGFARINTFTHRIIGYVLYGINDGEIISTQFINIKYSEADEIFAGFIPGVFFIRYNPA